MVTALQTFDFFRFISFKSWLEFSLWNASFDDVLTNWLAFFQHPAASLFIAMFSFKQTLQSMHWMLLMHTNTYSNQIYGSIAHTITHNSPSTDRSLILVLLLVSLALCSLSSQFFVHKSPYLGLSRLLASVLKVSWSFLCWSHLVGAFLLFLRETLAAPIGIQFHSLPLFH